MRPTVTSETLGNIRAVLAIVDDGFRFGRNRFDEPYAACKHDSSCSSYDDDEINTRIHDDDCPLGRALAELHHFVRIEEELHTELEGAEGRRIDDAKVQLILPFDGLMT